MISTRFIILFPVSIAIYVLTYYLSCYRVPSIPAAELQGHHACVNGIAWAPHSSCHICTAADDKQALIWDLSAMPKPIEGTRLSN